MRSRFTRIHKIYDKIKNNKGKPLTLDKIKKNVKKMNKNMLLDDESFQIKANSSFTKIIDFNDQKPFGNLFDEKCFENINVN